MQEIKDIYSPEDSSLMIQQINADIRLFFKNWYKDTVNKGKEHWYKKYLYNDITKSNKKISDLLNMLENNSIETLSDEVKSELIQTSAEYLRDIAGFGNLKWLGILEPTKFDEISEALGKENLAELGQLLGKSFLEELGGVIGGDGKKK